MAFAGAMLITPDTLLIRLSGLEGWGLTFWRGLLIGCSVFVLWLLLEGARPSGSFHNYSAAAIIIVVANGGNTLAFNFAAVETSITVVVTALATAPFWPPD